MSRQTYTCRDPCAAVKAASRTGEPAEKCGVCGSATHRSGPGATKRNGWAGSASLKSRLRSTTTAARSQKTRRSGGFSACAVAGHGRLQPLSGSPAHDLRQDCRYPGASRTRFHRSGTDQSVRGPDRPRQDAFHRLQQIGQHARAEHLQAIFLRARETGRRARKSRQPFHCDHRSWLQNAAGGGGRQVPAHLLRTAHHRRPLFGALEFRHGPRAP